MKLYNGQILYHGNYAAIDAIDLAKCAPNKDFGRGFYLTENYEQAKNFIHTSLLKSQTSSAKNGGALKQNYGFVNVYQYDENSQIPVFDLAEANDVWLWFIAYNRREELSDYLRSKLPKELLTAEIISGKIANDKTNPVLTAFLTGVFGEIYSDATINTAVTALLPNRLQDQVCFKSQRAIACLKKLEVHKHEL
jgi:hypothetical protein